ncbi:PREDICTED: dystrotelin-like [Dinoponera quadriceps]|uniref:Dystrotelin-like n=1 Tax=Dinoponera quadriceps TaxID=609295 RepID=A0A6P3YA63_DINQU|nr:PREDICTED: dystrotelin-like [Dinoponera quadriceps]XP_014487268.1 PREDICTED: dystrotelin-like [Dinoponera quadriceps]XP_014487269.1 PREDICTED: dystrotelin-like [Dinoponera quadriceps]XP_014487270.1 PREDICTED: dystrotelin-like [Dinoponera quadriceps]
MEDIIRSMQECNAIRYTSYRTAVKMQILHRELNMQHVQLGLIAGVFERHRLSITENCVNLDPSEIEDVLSDIYFAAQKESNFNFDVDLATKLATNYILRTFDKQNTRNILVFSVKVALVLLSNGRLQEKYGYLYQQLADHNACLSRASLHTLLTNICKITEMLGESIAYGYEQIQLHIDACFVKSQGCLGVTEAEFAAWIMQEPPLLVWITTFNRIKSAEHIVHNVRCSSCKVTPVQGPRYTCLKCTGYHQCQDCFLLGKTSNKHKLKHPIREYCVKTSHREVTKLIIELIRNKLRLCPTRTVAINAEDVVADAVSNETRRADCGSLRSTIRRKILSDPQKELQSIITHLEEENRQLQIELLDIRGTKAERLQRHRATIESQLQRLKTLKKYLFTDTAQAPQIITRMQSTPMLPPLSSRLTALPLEFELSPIIRQDNVQQGLKLHHRKNKATSSTFNTSLPIERTAEEDNANALPCIEEASTSSGFNMPESSRIELSTWIGGTRMGEMNPTDSGFSQWLAAGNPTCKEDNYTANTAVSSTDNDLSLAASQSPTGIHRDNTPSSLQRPDKHSQHSSLQNIQGDLNDILDRLQNMVANDCLLDESYDGNDNCKLKRATTEMEDLLTGLIEGMESRKSKLTTIV